MCYLLSQLLTILNVQFVQSLNVFIDERNRNDDEVLFSLFHVTLKCYIKLRSLREKTQFLYLNGIIRCWLQPRKWTNLGLPHQRVGITVLQLVHH